MKNKRITFTLLVILCLGIIFWFSHQNGKLSESLSDGFTIKIMDLYAKVRHKEYSNEEKEVLVKSLRTFIRKSAHFIIYLLLGFFSFLTLSSYGIKYPMFCSILFCFFYACSDEVHQLFVNARSGRIFDVFIDTCGACLGNGIVLFLKKYIMKRKNAYLKIS